MSHKHGSYILPELIPVSVVSGGGGGLTGSDRSLCGWDASPSQVTP